MTSLDSSFLVNYGDFVLPTPKRTDMLYPFRFEPIFRQLIWGGIRLGSLLGKPIGGEDDFAESWEVVDHGEIQSVVKFGSLKGIALHHIVEQYGEQLFGRHHPQLQFPLLFKFLDANQDLSVQVHPNDEQAARLNPPDLGKTEAWVILHADPDSVVYSGLKPNVNRQTLLNAIENGAAESCLHKVYPKVGDCFFIKAGTVHALGSGLVVAEIQQASDTTFRLFDWNRKDADGHLRQLHIEQALEVIDFDAGPVDPRPSTPTDDPEIQSLVSCDQFVMERWNFASQKSIAGDQQCHLLAVLSGSIQVDNDPAGVSLNRGETTLIPASSSAISMDPKEPSTVLHVTLP